MRAGLNMWELRAASGTTGANLHAPKMARRRVTVPSEALPGASVIDSGGSMRQTVTGHPFSCASCVVSRGRFIRERSRCIIHCVLRREKPLLR